MWQFNVQSSIAASHVASKLLVEGGLLVLTGANAALNATPSMIAYLCTLFNSFILLVSRIFDY